MIHVFASPLISFSLALFAAPPSNVARLPSAGQTPPSKTSDRFWFNWRGPNLNGSVETPKLPLQWSDDDNLRWKTDLPGWAGSSPVIWGDRIFLTSPSAESEDDHGEIGRKFRRMSVGVDGPGGRRILLICISRKDGSIQWQRTVDDGNKFYGKHNMASPSPVTDGKHVWAMSGTGRLAAFTVDGEPVWSFDLQKEYGKFGLFWGYASSPLLYEDKIIVQVLHGSSTKDPSYLVAFDKKSGEVAWRVERKTDATRECPDAYTTPTVIRVDGRDELIVSGANYVTAHDPNSGEEIWRCGGLNPDDVGNYRIVGCPLPAGDLVIASSREKPVLAVRTGGKGLVTDSQIAWRYTGKKGPDVPSIATDGERLYLLHDDGFITCLAAETGSVIWGPQRIQRGPYSASPLVAAGRVYCTNEEGTTTILAAGQEFQVLAVNKLAGGYTLSSFAVGDGELYLRTAKYLYCISDQ